MIASTTFKIKGPNTTVDPEEIDVVLRSEKGHCPDQNCRAFYEEEADLTEFPNITTQGKFVCPELIGETCTNLLAHCAQRAEIIHKGIYAGESEVEVSVNGHMQSDLTLHKPDEDLGLDVVPEVVVAVRARKDTED